MHTAGTNASHSPVSWHELVREYSPGGAGAGGGEADVCWLGVDAALCFGGGGRGDGGVTGAEPMPYVSCGGALGTGGGSCVGAGGGGAGGGGFGAGAVGGSAGAMN